MDAEAKGSGDYGDHSGPTRTPLPPSRLLLFGVTSPLLVVPNIAAVKPWQRRGLKFRQKGIRESGLKHLWSSFLLILYLPFRSPLDYFLVLFFISVGHNRALRKEIRTFVYYSLLKLPHRIM